MSSIPRASSISASIVAALLSIGASVASAKGKPPCRLHYEQAMTLYERGEFEPSLREFQRSYDVCRLPPLLVNITKLYLKLGQKAEARQAFDLYQRMDPEPSEGIRAEINALREQLAEAPPVIIKEPDAPELAPSAPSAPPAPPTVKPPESVVHQRQPPPLLAVAPKTKSAARSTASRWWLWSALGAVTVGAAVGIGVGVSRADRPPDSALGPVVIFR